MPYLRTSKVSTSGFLLFTANPSKRHNLKISRKRLTHIWDTITGIFKATPPKTHFLEDHVAPWISKWGVGMALHGEQGEGIHKEFNRLERNMASMKEPLQQLLAIMKKNIVATEPDIYTEILAVKKQKMSEGI